MQHVPDRTDAVQRAKKRTVFIINGMIDMALAGFFLGWGNSLLGLERTTAWLIAAILASGAIISFFVATLAFGRKGTGPALDEGEDAPKEDREPVVRR